MAKQPFGVIPLGLGTVAAGNEITGKPAVNLGEMDAIGMTWRSSGNSNIWVRGDLGAAQDIDFVSLIHANAQSGTTIRVRLGDTQDEVDGTADYDSTALPLISPAITRRDGLYSSHLELPSVQTKRWWRIDIGGHTGDFEAAKLVIGKKAQAQSYYSPGFQFGAEDLGTFAMTPWGVPDIQDGLIFRSLRFQLEWETEAQFEAVWRPFIEDPRVGRRGVVFWCHDPEAGPYRQAKSYLGWLRENPYAAIGRTAGRVAQEYAILSMI